MTETWCLSGRVPRRVLALFETALEALGGAQVTDAADIDGDIPLSLYFAEAPPETLWRGQVKLAAEAAGVPMPAFTLVPVAARDWVAESYAGLPAIHAGRFFVFGSHVENPVPAGAVPIAIDANVAFGTGHHETTRGCLLALDSLAKARRFRRPLDMGCGSGILALAMAMVWRRPVMAVDIDPASVRMTRENARSNRVGSLVRPLTGQGFADGRVRRAGPYDLIAANILAGPLCHMAGDLAAALRPGGRAVLSGLLRHQERQVLNRYRGRRLVPAGRVPLGDWVTLVLRAEA